MDWKDAFLTIPFPSYVTAFTDAEQFYWIGIDNF